MALIHVQRRPTPANHQPRVSVSGKCSQSELHIRILDDADPVLAVLTERTYFFCVLSLQIHFLLSCDSPENLPSSRNIYIIQPGKASLHHAATGACPIFACHLVQGIHCKH